MKKIAAGAMEILRGKPRCMDPGLPINTLKETLSAIYWVLGIILPVLIAGPYAVSGMCLMPLIKIHRPMKNSKGT